MTDLDASTAALVERARHAATGWQCFAPKCREWATEFEGINAMFEGKRQAAVRFYCNKHYLERGSVMTEDQCTRVGCSERGELHVYMYDASVVGCREHIGDALDAYHRSHADGVFAIVSIIDRVSA